MRAAKDHDLGGRRRSRGRGFTLLEVLVALAVLSVSLAAAVLVGGTQAGNLSTLRGHALATWVAGEVIEETRLQGAELAPGRRQGQMPMGYQNWFWDLNINATDVPEIVRLDVQVYADRERSRQVVELTGFAARSP